jgi:lipopolysaccharide biosynthesis regulator YciM
MLSNDRAREAARRFLQSQIEAASDTSWRQLWSAELLAAEGHTDSALRQFEELQTSSNPEVVSAVNFSMGEIFRDRGDLERAMTLYRSAAAGRRGVLALLHLGELQVQLGDTAGARAAFEEALARTDGQRADAIDLVAESYAKLVEASEGGAAARALLERLMSRYPEREKLRLLYAAFLATE